jgi:hypothetical protein
MKRWRALWALVALVFLGTTIAESAWAHGKRSRTSVHLGFHFGVPLHPYPWYHAPRTHYYPYYAPVVVVPAAPPVYIERYAESEPPRDVAPQHYWYYCAEARAYYPYVKQCPGGWQRVAPQPPPQ